MANTTACSTSSQPSPDCRRPAHKGGSTQRAWRLQTVVLRPRERGQRVRECGLGADTQCGNAGEMSGRAPLGCTHGTCSPPAPEPALPLLLKPPAGPPAVAVSMSAWVSNSVTSRGFATVALRVKPQPAVPAPGPAAATACSRQPSSTELRSLNCPALCHHRKGKKEQVYHRRLRSARKAGERRRTLRLAASRRSGPSHTVPLPPLTSP